MKARRSSSVAIIASAGPAIVELGSFTFREMPGRVDFSQDVLLPERVGIVMADHAMIVW